MARILLRGRTSARMAGGAGGAEDQPGTLPRWLGLRARDQPFHEQVRKRIQRYNGRLEVHSSLLTLCSRLIVKLPSAKHLLCCDHRYRACSYCSAFRPGSVYEIKRSAEVGTRSVQRWRPWRCLGDHHQRRQYHARAGNERGWPVPQFRPTTTRSARSSGDLNGASCNCLG